MKEIVTVKSEKYLMSYFALSHMSCVLGDDSPEPQILRYLLQLYTRKTKAYMMHGAPHREWGSSVNI
jgi:hypothetical protein